LTSFPLPRRSRDFPAPVWVGLYIYVALFMSLALLVSRNVSLEHSLVFMS
jgi:hypothetical protein